MGLPTIFRGYLFLSWPSSCCACLLLFSSFRLRLQDESMSRGFRVLGVPNQSPAP